MTTPQRFRLRAGLARLGVLTLLAASAALGLTQAAAPAPASATGATDSAASIKWAGGNDPSLQKYQVDHATLLSDGNGGDNGSGHWSDFKNLEVTVSQTAGLIDQAVTVSVKGFSGTVFPLFGSGGARNFLQIMQCWGPNPLADDFAETCQYGSWDLSTGDKAAGESIVRMLGEYAGRGDRQFRSVTGEVNKPTEVPTSGGNTVTYNGLADFFTASDSNEVPFAPVQNDGTTTLNVAVQSAAAQPYQGCGDAKAAGSRCWLVVVPRGSHSGTREGNSKSNGTNCAGPTYGGSDNYGDQQDVQKGSPVSANCTFWDDRVVVPLDFADPYSRCAAGTPERRMVGSEFASDAVSSWQSHLCAGESAATFNLVTNSGDLSRGQLLRGQASFALVATPLTADTIGTTDPALLDKADMGYAPVANTGLTVAFVATATEGKTQYRTIKLTPRLIAKMLTQSYKYDVPQVTGYESVGESRQFLQTSTLTRDGEWRALGNPTDLGTNMDRGAWVVSGPQGDDAISLLWRYVQADADAVAFLRGEEDPWGNTVNRYYLPAGHPNAAGGGLDAALATESFDNFLKADQTVTPDKSTAEAKHRGLQLDSLTLLPYSSSLTANAYRIFHVDQKYTNAWDPNKNSGANVGFWVDSGPQLYRYGQCILGPTTTSAAANYGLATASLALPSTQKSTQDNVAEKTFVAPSTESMQAALAAQAVDDDGVAAIDFGSLPTNAYPLTTTINAAVVLNAESLDAQARADYAHFLTYAATEGNIITGERGGLPEGYVPLTEEQIAAALALAARLTADGSEDDPETPGTDGSGGSGGSTAPGDEQPGTSGAGTTPGNPSGGPSLRAGAETEVTATAAVGPLSQVAVGGALLAGVAGLVASRFLLRRRTEGG